MSSVWVKLKFWLRRQSWLLRHTLRRANRRWSAADEQGLRQKRYRSYQEYVEHQQSKLETLRPTWLERYDVQYHQALRDRLLDHDTVGAGMRVLCLAARVGSEVKAFLDLGCFAVGLDLNPGARNKYVVYGDFHEIQYPDRCVDVVFTNSLDHVMDLSRLIREIKRVLHPSGYLIIEAARGEAEGVSPGCYETLSWKRIDDLLDVFVQAGFRIAHRSDFEEPWKQQQGEQVCFTLEHGGGPTPETEQIESP
jgi:ubiquinone/menaquinone biosynthesis C-methylase UbiE